MKTIKFILAVVLISSLVNLFSNDDNETISVQQIQQKHRNPPTFKYNYIDTYDNTFTILAYWESNDGIVYSFFGGILSDTQTFNQYQDFISFITPPEPDLKKYVIVDIK